MLMRVARTMRLRAGLPLALAYLLCVLMPGLSLAVGGARHAQCLAEEDHYAGIMHVHGQDVRVRHHVGVDLKAHEHAGAASAQKRGEGGPSVASNEATSTGGDQHKSAGHQCCGLTCISALPATVAEFPQPSIPPSVRVANSYDNFADNTSARLYRPPIA